MMRTNQKSFLFFGGININVIILVLRTPDVLYERWRQLKQEEQEYEALKWNWQSWNWNQDWEVRENETVYLFNENKIN